MEEAADKLHLFYKDDSTLSFRVAEAEPVVLHGIGVSFCFLFSSPALSCSSRALFFTPQVRVLRPR